MSNIQVCAALKKMSSVLRLGVYRERIEKYGVRRRGNPALTGPVKHPTPSDDSGGTSITHSGARPGEQIITVSLERQPGRHLGIR